MDNLDRQGRKLKRVFKQQKTIMLNVIAFLLITNIVVFSQCFAWKQKALENKVEVRQSVDIVTVYKEGNGIESMDANISFYCPCEKCCGKSDGITASGVKATPNHTIAMDKSVPFGTKVLIGETVYTVEDRGGAIKGNKIDVFVDNHEKALQLGRQCKRVYILNREAKVNGQN